MICFILILIIWAMMGFIGILTCKDEDTNFPMLFFIFEAPFIPLIAKLCGLI